MRPAQRKQLVGHLIDRYRVSVNRACQVCQQSRAGWYQKLKPKVLDVPLVRIALERGSLPRRIQVDNGPEFVSLALDRWAYDNGVTLDYSRPGKPTDNAFIESFNGSLRDECLNTSWFMSMDDARQKLENWRQDYNHFRPHSSLADTAPALFARQVAISNHQPVSLV